MAACGRARLLLLLLSAVVSLRTVTTCGILTHTDTLGYLSHERVKAVAAADATACCERCLNSSWCASWSYQHVWTPPTPCHLSPFGFERLQPNSTGNSCGTARKAPPGPPPPSPPPPVNPKGEYVVDTSLGGRRQVFEGVQVELQSDSIGSDNTGMPKEGTLVPDDDSSTIGAPHDLTPAERERFAIEVMRGVRSIRLAMGLFLRGMGPQNRSIVGRWPSQMAELKQLQDLSGIEGWAPEYWSPPAGWKDTGSYYTGTLASFDARFLEQFCHGVSGDVEYLRTNGLNVTWWGLQNEPGSWGNTTSCPPPADASVAAADAANAADAAVAVEEEEARSEVGGNSYSRCSYSQCDYYRAFKVCAAKIRALDPRIRIHANSWSGQVGAAPIANDPEALALVDAWTWHTVNAPSKLNFGNQTQLWNYGKSDFTNEHEYQPGSPFAGTEVGTVAAVNSFLNTLTFKDSPTGSIILHAIKPTTNLESLGYGWTWWRSTGSPAPEQFPSLQPQHFVYNYWNWNSVAPFVKTVPWNSRRLNVMEDAQRVHQRVVAFETPDTHVEKGPLHAGTAAGKLIIVVTNEVAAGFNQSYGVTVRTTDGAPRVWRGYSFKGDDIGKHFNVSISAPVSAVPSFKTTLAPNTVQWWYEQ